jgi:hypothetical protein
MRGKRIQKRVKKVGSFKHIVDTQNWQLWPNPVRPPYTPVRPPYPKYSKGNLEFPIG